MSESRKHPRISLSTEVWIGQDGIFTKTQRIVRNLSEGGAFIETTEGFQVDSVLSLRFILPSARDLISCAASVRHLGGGAGLGVQFLDISEADRRLVGAFVGDKRPGSSSSAA